MGEHIYEDVKVPARYRALLRRLQRGTYTRVELEWILRQHPDLPQLVAAVVREKLAQVGTSSPRGEGAAWENGGARHG